ncbi:MAG: hypothetical protein ACI4HM_08305, partial [Ruminococcus sp.]
FILKTSLKIYYFNTRRCKITKIIYYGIFNNIISYAILYFNQLMSHNQPQLDKITAKTTTATLYPYFFKTSIDHGAN